MTKDQPTAAFRATAHARTVCLVLVFGSMLPLAGCRICADCEDLAYPAYGGAWQRTSRESGRVGSVFDPGGAKMATLVNREEPDSVDEITREVQSARDKTQDPDRDPDRRGEDEDSMDLDDDTDPGKDFENRDLDDIENDAEERLRGRDLEDIEVRLIPGRKPKMVTTK